MKKVAINNIPLLRQDGTHRPAELSIRLSPQQSQAISDLWHGLDKTGERRVDGSHVPDYSAAVCWLIERVAIAGETATDCR